MTKQEILDHFKDINEAYNDCTRLDTLSRMLDELMESRHFPGGLHTCSTCEYGRSAICNDHGEYIIKSETQSCQQWRKRLVR